MNKDKSASFQNKTLKIVMVDNMSKNSNLDYHFVTENAKKELMMTLYGTKKILGMQQSSLDKCDPKKLYQTAGLFRFFKNGRFCHV